MTLGQGAGLVHHQRIDLAQHLDGLGVLEQRPGATAGGPMMEIGMARPSVHGQAMLSTATALIKAWASRGSGPQKPQITDVAAATPTTVGTK